MRKSIHLVTLLVTAPVALATGGCGDDMCQRAARHFEQCTGQTADLSMCDADLAEQVLQMSCEELDSDGGKGDWSCIFNRNCDKDRAAATVTEVNRFVQLDDDLERFALFLGVDIYRCEEEDFYYEARQYENCDPDVDLFRKEVGLLVEGDAKALNDALDDLEDKSESDLPPDDHRHRNVEKVVGALSPHAIKLVVRRPWGGSRRYAFHHEGTRYEVTFDQTDSSKEDKIKARVFDRGKAELPYKAEIRTKGTDAVLARGAVDWIPSVGFLHRGKVYFFKYTRIYSDEHGVQVTATIYDGQGKKVESFSTDFDFGSIQYKESDELDGVWYFVEKPRMRDEDEIPFIITGPAPEKREPPETKEIVKTIVDETPPPATRDHNYSNLCIDDNGRRCNLDTQSCVGNLDPESDSAYRGYDLQCLDVSPEEQDCGDMAVVENAASDSAQTTDMRNGEWFRQCKTPLGCDGWQFCYKQGSGDYRFGACKTIPLDPSKDPRTGEYMSPPAWFATYLDRDLPLDCMSDEYE